jgi:EpsI family protein
MIKQWRFYILYLILALVAVYVHTRSEATVPVNKSLDFFPRQIGDWRMTGQERFDERTLEVLRPSDYLSRGYVDSAGNKISLYIGFHDGGPLSGPIHSPKQCLPGSGWNRLNSTVREVVVNGQRLPYVVAIYQKDMQKQMFHYWFQVRDDILTNEYALKFAMAKNSFMDNRRDSSFIRLSQMITRDESVAIDTGELFIKDVFPVISSMLPQ